MNDPVSLGPYELTRRLGSGGMGDVHEARDTRLDRTVALKVLPVEIVASPEARARFLREAKLAAASAKTVDLRVSKTFRFGKRASATVFWEMFNAFNWTSFTTYSGSLESPNFGLPTAAGDMRRQQLGFRLDF